MAEIFSVCQAFSIVELSRLVVVKDLDDIADLLVVEMKLSCFFIVYDWHIVSPHSVLYNVHFSVLSV